MSVPGATGTPAMQRTVTRSHDFAVEPVPVGACTGENVLARRRILNACPENVLMGPLGSDGVVSFADEPAPADRRGVHEAGQGAPGR